MITFYFIILGFLYFTHFLKHSYLGFILSPQVISILLSYMDTISLTKLEQCCHLLRNTIASTRENKRRVNAMMNNHLQSNEEEDNQSEEENSIQYKLILVRELRRYLNNNKNWKIFIFYILFRAKSVQDSYLKNRNALHAKVHCVLHLWEL